MTVGRPRKFDYSAVCSAYLSGLSVDDCAAAIGVHRGSVLRALGSENVQVRPRDYREVRKNNLPALGFRMGTLKRVACCFTDAQIEAINAMREKNDMSFSAQVQAIVAQTLGVS